MKTAEERYEETWNSYLELLNKDPRASLVSFTKLKSVYYRGMTKWMSHNGLSVYDAKAKIRECHRKSLSGEPVSCNTTSMFLPVTADETASGNNNNTATEEPHGKKEEEHVQADNENHKEKARPSRQDNTAKGGEI